MLEFEAERLAADEAVDRKAEAIYSKDFLDSASDELLVRLRSCKSKTVRYALHKRKGAIPLGVFRGMHTLLAEFVSGPELATHLTEFAQVAGSSGKSLRVTHQFHVRSGYLIKQMLGAVPGEEEEKKRCGHTILKPSSKVVHLMAPLTFKRSGPRNKPHKATFTVTGSFGTLTARSQSTSCDWNFHETIALDNIGAAKQSIALALLSLGQRRLVVPKALLLEAREEVARA